MDSVCPKCGGSIPGGAKFCPACGSSPEAPGNPTSASGLTENVAGMLSYITIAPAIVFLVIEPYNKSRFVRFHAFQSILYWVSLVAVAFLMGILTSFSSILGLLLIPLQAIIWLAFLVVWVLCVVKAFNHEKFKLPVIGDMAEQQASKG